MKHVTNLYFNYSKMRGNQPDITGKLVIDETRWRIALWSQETKDGARDYFSGNMAQDGAKTNPRFKLKLYQFAKAKPDDPDYHDANFDLGGTPLFGYLWIRRAKGDLDVIFELSDKAREQKPSELASAFKARMAERFSKPKATVGHNEYGEPNDIDF
jgi:hypothetical protein